MAANENLARELRLLRNKAAGPKSERYVEPETLMLPLGGLVNPPPRSPTLEPEMGVEQPARRRGPREGHARGRRDLEDREDLPTRTLHCAVDPNSKCPSCQGALTGIGDAVSWRVEWVSGHFERLRIEREKCVCRGCPNQGVLAAPEPPFALPRAMCGNGLLAQILVDKFADHLPLNRQARRMERAGFDIGTDTLASWVLGGASLLERIALAIDEDLLSKSTLRGDDTGYPVQDAGNGSLRKGRLWVFTDGELARYHFTGDKKGERPATLLSGFHGRLVVDCGSEFNRVCAAQGLQRGGCWSHLRRYFFDARHENPNETGLALGTIRDLFGVEASLRDAEPGDRLATRRTQIKPLVDGFFAWVKAISLNIRPKSSLGSAVRYALGHEAEFRLFLDHADVPMHNNLSELLLRGPVVGRKNWLFSRSEGGAKAAAVMFTLIGSCMLQGIDPLVYLTDVLNRVQDHIASKVHELTPKNWRLARAAATTPAASPVGG